MGVVTRTTAPKGNYMPNTHGGPFIAKGAPGMLALPDGFAFAAYAGTHAACTEQKGLLAALPASKRNRNPLCPLPKNVPHR